MKWQLDLGSEEIIVYLYLLWLKDKYRKSI